MKLHFYTNNAYDTVALVNDENQVVSHWNSTTIEDALNTSDMSEFDNQFLEIEVEDFEKGGQDLFLVVRDGGEWEFEDRDRLESRLRFHLGKFHPIVQALNI